MPLSLQLDKGICYNFRNGDGLAAESRTVHKEITHFFGLYYLQSWYYDPEVGCFLNADVVFDYDAGIQGYNLFVYCGNEPIFRIDCSGTDSEKVDDLDLADDQIEEKGGASGGFRSSGSGEGSSGGGGYIASAGDSGIASTSGRITSGGFRGQLQKFTGQSGTGQQAHHVFPQKYTNKWGAVYDVGEVFSVPIWL